MPVRPINRQIPRYAGVLDRVNANEMYGRYFPRANAQLGVNSIDPDWFESAACYRDARVCPARH